MANKFNISLKKSFDSIRNAIHIDFIDKNTKNKVGQLEYQVKNKKAEISNTYMFPEYRYKGILKKFFPNIAKDIRCNGADKIELTVLNLDAKAAWKSLGFEEVNKNKMSRDISEIESKCIK